MKDKQKIRYNIKNIFVLLMIVFVMTFSYSMKFSDIMLPSSSSVESANETHSFAVRGGLPSETYSFAYIPNNPSLPWLSGTFEKYFNTLHAENYKYTNLSKEELKNVLQEHLNQKKDWYFVGTRCMTYVSYMLSLGVSFESVTLNLTQSFVVSSFAGAGFGTHIILGDQANPFKGTFNGNGYTISLDAGLNSLSVLPENIHVDSRNLLGFFGVVENAVVKNLTVNTKNISGNATGNPSGNETDSFVGGIAAIAKDSVIINCVNEISFSGITGTPESIGAIVGYAEDTSIINCVDASNFGSLTSDDMVGGEILNSLDFDEWDALGAEEAGAEKQVGYIKAMNQNVFNYLSHNLNIKDLLFWGIDEVNGYPLLNSPKPLFDEVFVFNSKLKEFAFDMVHFSYLDNRSFIDNETVEGQDAISDMDERYAFFLTELNNLSIYEQCGDCGGCLAGNDCESPNIKSFMNFFNEASAMISGAIYDFDLIYWDWYEIAEQINADNFKQEKITILETTFNELMSNISDSKIRAKIVLIYSDALSEIDSTSLENSDWSSFSYEIATIINHAEAEFNKILAEWNNSKRITSIIIGCSTVGASVLITGIIVMVVYLKRKYKKFVFHESIDEDTGKNASMVKEKAELMAQVIELQREMTEKTILMKKEKTKLIADAKEEKAKILAQALSDRSGFEAEKANIIATAKKEKEEAIELVRKEITETAAQIIKEKMAEMSEKIVDQKDDQKEKMVGDFLQLFEEKTKKTTEDNKI